MRDFGAPDEARRHHPPADRALQRAEHQQRQQSRLVPGRDRAARPENGKRHCIGQPDQPTEQAMNIFPEKNALELGKRHAAVHQLILRARLIGSELRLPFGIVQRRQRTRHDVPSGDRQAGFGQPRDAADHDHGKDQPGDREQPERDRAWSGRIGWKGRVGNSKCGHGSPIIAPSLPAKRVEVADQNWSGTIYRAANSGSSSADKVGSGRLLKVIIANPLRRVM